MQWLIVILLVAIIASLFVGFYFLITRETTGKKLLNSLIIRVGLSAFLLIIIYGYLSSVHPSKTDAAQQDQQQE